MPIPTVTCSVCNKHVNKRQTIAVDGGRVCRDHNEAKEFQRKVEHEKVEANNQKKWQEAEDNLNIIMIVENIRILAYRKNLDIHFTYYAISHTIPSRIRDRVKEELKKAKSVKQEEFDQALMTGLLLAARSVTKEEFEETAKSV